MASRQKASDSAWGKLDKLCRKAHDCLYRTKRQASATSYADRLEEVLHKLPEADTAILGHEGLALLSEMKGNIREAIAHRKREIELTERLHKEAESSKYTDSTRAYMLRGRSAAVLRERRAILEELEKVLAQQRNGMVPGQARKRADR